MNVEINNDIWCELEVEHHVCKYKFLLMNIPSYVGGRKKSGDPDDDWRLYNKKDLPETIEGTILCDSDENAQQCMLSLKALVENGYGNHPSWMVGLDMGDLFKHFDGKPMKFLHKAFGSTFDDESLKTIKERVKNFDSVVYSFSIPEEEDFHLNQIEMAYEKILPNRDAEVLWQLSLVKGSARTLDILYR